MPLTDLLDRKQPALGAEPRAAVSLEWRVRDAGAAALWHALRTMSLPAGTVLGIGAPLAHAAGAVIDGLAPFARLQRGRYTMPATQRDLWALAGGATADEAFDRADALHRVLTAHVQLVESTPMFNYREGRDLTGYKDGTENPKGDDAWDAALVADGDGRGGSFVMVQRYLHFRSRFAALPQHERDDTIGRTQIDDEEIAEASETSHVKRTAQEDFEPAAFMLRRSMPWGDPRRHGLVFIAFTRTLDVTQRQLARMMGLERDGDGRQDALLAHTQAESGSFYWCPPCVGGRLALPAASVPVPIERPQLAPAVPVVRLMTNGPLDVEGALSIAGTAATRARLCRCGRSASKPYCDSSHVAGGFVAAGDVPPIDEPQAAVAPAVLHVQPAADGPLLLSGAVEICGESGRTITRCHAATLCRCGQSANKPFCDGSHAAIAFHADP